MVKKKSTNEVLASEQVERLILAIEGLARSIDQNTGAPDEPVRKHFDERVQYEDGALKMFEALDARPLPRKTEEFIADLRSDFDTYGSLSNRQMDCLVDNYNKFINGIPFRRQG